MVHIMLMAMIFILFGMVLEISNDLTYLLNSLWEVSQRCRRFELFTKQPDASSKKGVVGSPGTTIPTNPRATKRLPSKI